MKNDINNKFYLRELYIFFHAIMFFTRLPSPRFVNFHEAFSQAALRYFPIIGLFVGSVCASVLLISKLALPTSLAVLLSMIAGILLTGALHEDGWADCCDAFGGGYGREKTLTIMKDPHLGTYGVIGLMSMLGIKFILLLSITEQILALDLKYLDQVTQPEFLKNIILLYIFLFAHSISRLHTLYIVFFYKLVRSEKSKSQALAENISTSSLTFATLITLTLLSSILLVDHISAALPNTLWYLGSALFIPCLPTFIFAKYSAKHIGGYTGDCLGAVQQISEVVIYLIFFMCITSS